MRRATKPNQPTSRSVQPTSALAYSVVGFLAAFAALVTFYATKEGVGLAFDSINYLTAAHNFANGDGLRTGTLEPFTIAPPGLSVLLAPAIWLGWNEEGAARLAGIGCYAATVVLSFVLARRHLRSTAACLFVAAVTAASSSLLFVMTLALTEPMFVVVVLSFILVAERAWSGWTLRHVLAMASLVWLAFAFRYVGLFLIPAGIVCLLTNVRAARMRSILGAALFTAVSLVFPALWMARNHAADGTIMGPRPASLETFAGVRTRFIDVLQVWAWPEVTTRWAFGLAMVAGLVAAVALVRRTESRLAFADSSRSSVLPMVIVAAFYISYLVYGELTTAVDPIDRRLMSPLFVPAVIGVALVAERAMRRLPSVTPLVGGLAALALVVQTTSTLNAAHVGAEEGIYMQNDSFRREPQALALQSSGLAENDVVFSNVRMNFWIALRHQPARYWPRHFYHYSPTELDEVPTFLDALGCGTTYAVWYGAETDPPGEYLSPTELREFVDLEPLENFPTGINYRVVPKQPVQPKSEAECREMNLRL
jgi:hypothetical protein